MTRRTRRKASMSSRDYGYTGGPWLCGWGNERRMAKRIERARRKREAQREIRRQDVTP